MSSDEYNQDGNSTQRLEYTFRRYDHNEFITDPITTTFPPRNVRGYHTDFAARQAFVTSRIPRRIEHRKQLPIITERREENQTQMFSRARSNSTNFTDSKDVTDFDKSMNHTDVTFDPVAKKGDLFPRIIKPLIRIEHRKQLPIITERREERMQMFPRARSNPTNFTDSKDVTDFGKGMNHTETLKRTFSNYSDGKTLTNDDEDDILHILKKLQADEVENCEFVVKEQGVMFRNSLLNISVVEGLDKVSRELIKMAPSLIRKERKGNGCRGLTPFHFAIANNELELTKEMAGKVPPVVLKELLSVSATSPDLMGTVMMGELPLSIAVLNNSANMIQLLLDCGADVMAINSRGETLVHTLILSTQYKFGSTKATIEMLKTLQIILDKYNFRSLMFLQNREGLSPLQLTAKNGQYDLFEYLIGLDYVYSYRNRIWGLNGICKVDITELDGSRWRQVCTKRTREAEDSLQKLCKPSRLHSGLETLFFGPVSKAIQFMSNEVVDDIITQKWQHYRLIYFMLGVIHISLMCLLTSLGVLRTYIFKKLSQNEFEHEYVTAVTWLSLVFGLLYITQETVRTFVFRQPLLWGQFHHNFIYRISFFVFGIFLILDSVWNLYTQHTNNYCLYVALIFGWFSCLFFLRGYSHTSFYSYMFLTSLFGEVLFFLPVMLPLFMPFPVAMHDAFLVANSTTINGRAESTIQGFEHYWISMFTMFQWMNGFGETGDVQKIDNAYLSVTAFVLFIILDHIVLLNIIIALLTNREDLKNTDRHLFAKLQKLSMILFLEDFLVGRLRLSCGERVDLVHEKVYTCRYTMMAKQIQEKDSEPKTVISPDTFLLDRSVTSLDRHPINSDNPFFTTYL